MSEQWPVRASDGHELELFVEMPDEPRAVLLFACAMGVEASYYAPFAKAMSRRGIAIAICDLRGHGTSSVRPRRGVDFGYREIVEHDLPAAVAAVRERTRGLPLYLGGHSLGGQLVMLHVAATHPDIDGMALVACAIPYYRNWNGRGRFLIRSYASLVFPAVGSVLGYVPGDRLGFGGKEARTLMRDWSHNAMTARYEPIGSDLDYEAALERLEVELVTVNIRRLRVREAAARARLAHRGPAIGAQARSSHALGSRPGGRRPRADGLVRSANRGGATAKVTRM
jgi:predicted alpha/beta hydrolase